MNQKGFVNIILIAGIVVIIGVVVLFVLSRQTLTPTPESSPSTKPSPVSTLISWDEAIKVLNSGKVKRIFQAHSLETTLILKDGEVLKTKSPRSGAVYEEVSRCGTVCEGIGVGIE